MSDAERTVRIRSIADCNTAWATRIVNRHVRGACVHHVEAHLHDSGTTAHISVQVEHDAGPSVPRAWFVKAPPRALSKRLLVGTLGLLRNEAHFYTTCAAELPLQVPQCLGASSERFGATVVLGDLRAAGCQPGVAGDELGVARVEHALRTLAALHAFGRQAPIQRVWRDAGGAMRRMEQRLGNVLAVPLSRRGLHRAGQAIPVALHAPVFRYARRRAAYQAALQDAPLTLVHHDCHPGNWFWRDDTPGLLDWQLSRLGEGIGDVAYLLATSLSPDVLADEESRLLQAYAQALRARGGFVYDSVEHMARRYRMHLAYAFEAMLMTHALGGFMPRAASQKLVERTAAAAQRNASFTDARLWPR